MVLLIDGDILVYRTGFSCKEDDPVWVARSRLDKTIEELRKHTNCKDVEIYLSDSLENNFRYEIFPKYKANRKQTPKPFHYESLSNELVSSYPTYVASGQEADDELGIRATRLGESCIIASIDKDLLQIPGRHYNWVRNVWRDILPPEGLYRFYIQLLVGDQSDNITTREGLSCPGVGERKAEKYLEGCETVEQYNETVFEIYKKHLPMETPDEDIVKRIETTGQLLKIRTVPGEVWKYDTKSRGHIRNT